jgi:hypothetical protein
LIAEGTAVGTEGIIQAVRLEGAASPEGIGRGIRIEWIRTQLAKILGLDGERQWQQQEQKEEDNPHGEPRIEHVASKFSLLPARRSAQAVILGTVAERCVTQAESGGHCGKKKTPDLFYLFVRVLLDKGRRLQTMDRQGTLSSSLLSQG